MASESPAMRWLSIYHGPKGDYAARLEIYIRELTYLLSS